MKKYTSILLTFLFILGLFAFSGHSVQAYDYGCAGGGLYSTTTGQYCGGSSTYSTTTYDPGCVTGGPYNTITGQLCYGSQYGSQYNYNGGGYGSNVLLTQYLSLGSKGNDVITLQQTLKNQGYYTGTIDGIYGRRTVRAVRDFQDDNGLSITGSVDASTMQALNNLQISIPTPYPCPLAYGGTTSMYPYPYPCPPIPGLQAPTISGVSGSQSLSVNQQGTWTVTAYDRNGGNLSYSVIWGDENVYPYLTANSLRMPLSQQSATFTHSYLQAGTYSPTFTVTNSSGQSAQTSLTVTVVGSIGGGQNLNIYSLSPSSGRVGTQVTIYGTGFNYNGCSAYACTNVYSSPNTINFGGNVIQNVYSYNGTSLTFTVPTYSTLACLYSNPPCNIAQSQLLPGSYLVSVTNSSGTSNNLNFTVTY